MWTSLIIAIIAGFAAFSTWKTKPVISLIAGFVFLIASLIASIVIFFKTVAVIVKLIPVALLALAIYVVVKKLQDRNSTPA